MNELTQQNETEWEEIYVCTDCYMVHGTGELDPNWTEEECETFLKKIEDTGEYVPGDSEKDLEFDWQVCQCCYRPLGGTRHHMYWKEG